MLLKKQETFIEHSGRQVPFVIILEPRRSVRVSFGSKSITLRLPWMMASDKKLEHIEKSKQWAIKQLVAKPGLLSNLLGKQYAHGQTLTIYGKTYVLSFFEHERNTNKAIIKNNLIELHLSSSIKEQQRQETVKYLLGRSIANDFYETIANRVHVLNQLHFNKTIKTVKIKLSQTNWGSCSTQGNINLSARLLFAPPIVIDYVIIHELAHLIEHNHSDRFWALVSRAMPDYKIHDQWLSKNSHLCDF